MPNPTMIKLNLKFVKKSILKTNEIVGQLMKNQGKDPKFIEKVKSYCIGHTYPMFKYLQTMKLGQDNVKTKLNTLY